jgi:TatD DNase family protein
MFFDSHCHLTAEQFDADREAVIQRAIEVGVTGMLTLATDVESSRAVIALAEKYQGVYAAVGIHPESVKSAEIQDLKLIRELAQHPKVVAIGEIGLDYYWDRTTIDLQQTFFEKQLELAAELKLPVAIHDRDAHAAVLQTLREWNVRRTVPNVRNDVPLRGVLHAFSGSVEMAEQAFELGYVVSFGGPVTFKNNKDAPGLVQALPLENILIETDSPYLAPQPYRGKRNEPRNVIRVAEKLAELKGLSTEQVATQTTKNAQALFGRVKH